MQYGVNVKSNVSGLNILLMFCTFPGHFVLGRPHNTALLWTVAVKALISVEMTEYEIDK